MARAEGRPLPCGCHWPRMPPARNRSVVTPRCPHEYAMPHSQRPAWPGSRWRVPSGPGLDGHAAADRQRKQLDTRACAQPAHQHPASALDGTLRDPELPGDLLVAQSLEYAIEYIAFPARETLYALRDLLVVHQLGITVEISLRLAHRGQRLESADRFLQEGERPRPDRIRCNRRAAQPCQDDDRPVTPRGP